MYIRVQYSVIMLVQDLMCAHEATRGIVRLPIPSYLLANWLLQTHV